MIATWDTRLFLALNGWGSPWLDGPMTLLSATWPWAPVLLTLVVIAWKKWGLPIALWWCLGGALAVGAADFTASGILKPSVARYRPCQPESGLEGVLLLDGHCGGKYGFASSHAANFFALACWATLLTTDPRWRAAAFSLAGLVGYSRIYLGVHYPGDVLAGFAIGFAFAWAGAISFRRWALRGLNTG